MATLFFAITPDMTYCFLDETKRKEFFGEPDNSVVFCQSEISDADYDFLANAHKPVSLFPMEALLNPQAFDGLEIELDDSDYDDGDGAHDMNDFEAPYHTTEAEIAEAVKHQHLQSKPNKFGGLSPIDFAFDTSGIM